MKKVIGVILMLGMLWYALSGCDQLQLNGIDLSETATLRVYVSGVPGEFQEVSFTFSEISAQIGNMWISVMDTMHTISLPQWATGELIEIGETVVPAGDYSQLQLLIARARVLVGNEIFEVVIPDSSQAGMKLIDEFVIDPGTSFELIIDFDINRSIISVGPPGNPISYHLRPVMRVIPRALSGSLSATVTNPEHEAVACALQNGDTLTTARVHPQSGAFLLGFLPGGDYTIMVSDKNGAAYQANPVEIIAGENKDLGEITLQ